jgi:23S rRNA pseudouridine2605 synthase
LAAPTPPGGEPAPVPSGLRLNKVLAQAGLASRRGADALIRSGRVTVDGRSVTEPGTIVDPAHDVVRLDGQPIPRPERHVYLAVYKPRYVVATAADPEGRPSVVDLVPSDVRLFPVGRLDFESEGLLILTNDGDLANRATHPRFGQEKEYRVKISGTPTEAALAAWRDGLYLEDGRTLPARVRVESGTGAGTWLRMTLSEGRNRQVRRMIEAMHHTVHRLIRVRIGPVSVGDLKPGQSRPLTGAECDVLMGRPTVDAPAEASVRPARRRYKPGWARPRARAGRRRG